MPIPDQILGTYAVTLARLLKMSQKKEIPTRCSCWTHMPVKLKRGNSNTLF